MLTVDFDIELLQALKQGCQLAFDKVYETYSKPLYIYLYDKLKDAGVCQDIIQDLFITLWEKRETIEINTSLKAYLYQSARYKIVDLYRKQAQYQKYLTQLGDFIDINQYDVVDVLHHRKKLEDVMQTVNRLPLRMKEIFILSRFENQSVKEISAKLNLSQQTIKNQLSKALNTLRTHHLLVLILLFRKF